MLFFLMYLCIIKIKGWMLYCVVFREKITSTACLSGSGSRLKYIFHCRAQFSMRARSWFKVSEDECGSRTTSNIIASSDYVKYHCVIGLRQISLCHRTTSNINVSSDYVKYHCIIGLRQISLCHRTTSNIIVSSANVFTCDRISVSRSFIKIRKSSGPNTEP